MDSDITFHYPPELLILLVDTIPRLVKGKRDVLTFFQGSGVPASDLEALRAQLARDKDSLNKFEIARRVLTRLNEAGERALALRRQVLRRVVEFESFESCYENERLKAKGLVQEIQRVVNVKDAFTKMNVERDKALAERRKAHEAKVAAQEQHAARRQALKTELSGLFAEQNPWRRGKRLESVLNRIFDTEGILIREAFTLKGDEGRGIVEQIDGVIEVDSHVYLVEMKWHGSPLGPGHTAQHLVRVMSRADARGLYISDSEYTKAVVDQAREFLAQRVIVLCLLEEIVRSLDGAHDFASVIRSKVRHALAVKQPFLRVT